MFDCQGANACRLTGIVSATISNSSWSNFAGSGSPILNLFLAVGPSSSLNTLRGKRR